MYRDYDDSIEEYKATKGDKATTEKRKKIESALKQVKADLENLATIIKAENATIADKVTLFKTKFSI